MIDTREIATAALPERSAPAAKEELRVVIREAAFDRAVARAHAEPGREVGGVLVGELCRDDRGPWLDVVGSIDALHADEKDAEITFTHATWDHIHRELGDRKIVGWYHTHPGFGVFLSERDAFIHKSFFNLPFQIALVYDPRTREHGVFVWRDGEPWRARRYFVGAGEHLWDGPRAAPPPRPAAAPVAETRRVPLVLATALAFLLGSLAGFWLAGHFGL